jgi:hypothetical protein
MRRRLMTRYNWNAIPKKYNWVGVDSHGIIRSFVKRPVAAAGYWVDGNGDIPDRLGELPYLISVKDWEESLEERPKPEPRYKMGYDRWDSTTLRDDIDGRYLTMGEILDMLNEREQ